MRHNVSQCRMTDTDLLGALTVPARQGDYPRYSRAFVRIDTSLRIYWHTLFDICPHLLELTGPDGLALFRPFMTWAYEQKLSLNWTYYLWVDAWLQQSPLSDRVTADMRYAMMGASAARWATGDRSEYQGIVLASPQLPDLVCGWKTVSFDGGREIERIELEAALPAPAEPFGYFLLRSRGLDNDFPGWLAIPR